MPVVLGRPAPAAALQHRPCRFRHDGSVKRVVILGPGAAGKSTLAIRLGEVVGLRVVELDERFWNAALEPMAADEWQIVQTELAQQPAWIMDGDLGPYDVLEPRLQRADTVIVLDVARWRCLWRSFRRSRERLDFWRWLWTWRRRSRPRVLAAIAAHADQAHVEVLRSPADADRWLETVAAR
jgi:adenylate kinase family enzyme